MSAVMDIAVVKIDPVDQQAGVISRRVTGLLNNPWTHFSGLMDETEIILCAQH